MLSTLIRGGIVVLAAGLVIGSGSLLGVEDAWPLILLAGVALAPRMSPGTIVAVVIGASSWWAAMGLRAGVLRDANSSEFLAAAAAIALVMLAAAMSRERIPMWAGLVGIGAFAGLYEPQFAANPTLFLEESPLALASLGVATSIAALAGVAAAWLQQAVGEPTRGHARVRGEGVRS